MHPKVNYIESVQISYISHSCEINRLYSYLVLQIRLDCTWCMIWILCRACSQSCIAAVWAWRVEDELARTGPLVHTHVHGAEVLLPSRCGSGRRMLAVRCSDTDTGRPDAVDAAGPEAAYSRRASSRRCRFVRCVGESRRAYWIKEPAALCSI
jgi:hypothetical protein